LNSYPKFFYLNYFDTGSKTFLLNYKDNGSYKFKLFQFPNTFGGVKMNVIEPRVGTGCAVFVSKDKICTFSSKEVTNCEKTNYVSLL
jgi:hypothetical protein